MSWLRGWGSLIGGGTSGHIIEDEGTPLAQRSNLNFAGAGVTATDAGGKTLVTIPGGGGGIDTSFKRMVIINPSISEVAGKVYNSIANAKTYFGTLGGGDAVTTSNPFAVYVTGINTEAFSIDDAVPIIGEKGITSFSGAVSFNGSNPQLGLAVNCDFDNLTGGNGKYANFFNCSINGGTLASGTGGATMFAGTTIFGGNFANAGSFNLYNCLLVSQLAALTLPSSIVTRYCHFIYGGQTFTVNGGSFKHTNMSAGITLPVDNNYYFHNCDEIACNFPQLNATYILELRNSYYLGAVFNQNGGILSMYDSSFLSAPTYTSGSRDIRNSYYPGLANGTTANRPPNPELGQMYFDSTLGYPVFFDNNGTTGWCDATGSAV